ncbi:hypothetical protein B4113_2324 [Geobacillus sp. B4113_201601]|nr:hypothetical protein B4113_2324 [Geobacillus sp. B4113_201601]
MLFLSLNDKNANRFAVFPLPIAYAIIDVRQRVMRWTT